MSRFSEYDYDGDGIPPDLWQHNLEMALGGKRGQAALRELREALMALPERKLIGGAMCTVGAASRREEYERYCGYEFDELVQREGEGVCAIGAYVWHKNVKAGMDPQEAFARLPTLLGVDGDEDWQTTALGQRAGLTMTLAWHLAQRNDDTFEAMTPAGRFTAFIEWIDKQRAPVPGCSAGEVASAAEDES